MRRLILAFFAAIAVLFVFVSSSLAAYAYFDVENLYTPTWSNFNVSGTLTPIWWSARNYGGLGAGSQGWMTSTLSGEPVGEVDMTLRLATSSPQIQAYALFGCNNSTNYQVAGNGPPCNYMIEFRPQYNEVFEITVLGNQLVYPGGQPTLESYEVTESEVTITDNSVLRSVVRQDSSGGNDIYVYINNNLAVAVHDTGPNVGFSYSPYGMKAPTGLMVQDADSNGTLVSELQLGQLDTTPPNQIPASSISTTPSWNQINISWPAGSDGSNGIGIYGYQLYRNGQLLTTTTGLSYVDTADIVPNTTYDYTLSVIDYHWNVTSTNFTVQTPNVPTNGPFPSVIPDGRSVGTRPTGTYWGGTGENINVMSGNLNYVLPLLTAMGRGNSSVQFNLVYNSQNWGQNGSTQLNYGGDVGYGYGWQLLAGSITPVWNPGGLTASYYLYTDSTGAQYHLNQDNNNVWSSSESAYIWFDANANVLHFRNGSFWNFGCISAGTEADSGVMHPTQIEDSNGNQILIRYQQAPGATWANSSARITQIEDVRATTQSGKRVTYAFTYKSDAIPHLTAITNYIQTGEAYTFTYSENQPLSSPFNGQSFGATTWLASTEVTNLGATNVFSYDGSGEMTKVVLPYGAYLAYSYSTTTYSSTGISYREVANRYLSADGTQASQLTYPLTHESSPVGPTHQYSQISDPSGNGQKYWSFNTSGTSISLLNEYQGQQLPGPTAKTQTAVAWTQDANGNNYVGSSTTTLDPGQSYSATKESAQTLDNYGNVTQVQYYNYGTPGSGNAGSIERTYNYSYLTSSAYTSRYIFNRQAVRP